MLRSFALSTAILAATLAAPAAAQTFPSRPIQVIMPFSPGGAPDLLARALAEGMTPLLGQAVVVVNRDGAGGTLGTGQVATARPDGYTVGFSAAGSITTRPYIVHNLGYTYESFDPICQTFELHIVLAVHPDSRLRSFADFVAAARARPEEVTVGHTGPGSPPHLAVAMLEGQAGIKVNHIAYRGDGQLLQNLAGQHVDVAAAGLGSISGQNVRALAVFAARRLPSHPDLPTVTELGFTVQRFAMGGMFAPRGLPADVRARLERGCEEGVRSAAYLAMAERLRQPVLYFGGAAYMERLAAESRVNAELIQRLGITAE